MPELLLGAILGVGISSLIAISVDIIQQAVCARIRFFRNHPKLYVPIATALISMIFIVPLSVLITSAEKNQIDREMIIAQSYYDTRDYTNAAAIYMKWAQESGIAAYNLAYMYSVGHGVPLDRDASEKYYRTSSNLGTSEAVTGVVFLHVNTPISYSDTIEALKFGYEFGDKCTINFIARSTRYAFEKSLDGDDEGRVLALRQLDPNTLCEEFFDLSLVEQSKILECNLYLWKSEYIVIDSRDELPQTNISRKYTYVSSEIQAIENESFFQKVLYTTYLEESYRFLYLGCFNFQEIIRV